MATFRKEILEHFPESDGSSLVFLAESDVFQFVIAKGNAAWKLLSIPAAIVREQGVGESWGELIEQFKKDATDAQPPVPKQQSKTSGGTKTGNAKAGADSGTKEPAANPTGGSKS